MFSFTITITWNNNHMYIQRMLLKIICVQNINCFPEFSNDGTQTVNIPP